MTYPAKKPLIFGHRGASKVAPENTISAFLLAAKLGADGIELDAKLSKDGQVIVIHDQSVDRTTNGHGLVHDMSLNDLQELDAGIKYSQKYNGERIPTLEEVFIATGGKILVNVELTNYATPGDDLLEKVAGIVRKYQINKSIIFSSFFPRNILRIRKLLPGIPAGLLASGGVSGALSRSWIGRIISPGLIHPNYQDVTAKYIMKQHAYQRGVNVWDVIKVKDFKEMIDIGVDGIITDDVETAVKLLSNM